VEDLAQVDAALAAGSDRLLLDNFTASELATAVEQVAGRAQLEASGGIDLDNIRTMAATGVDMISIGALTKNVNAVDFSMLFQNNAHP
jgi:nicotinate-nucleotide pyrophosphorylase (carboxylating)